MSPNPKPKGGLVAYLTVDGATKAASFYEKAFAAERANLIPVDERGRTMHIHLYINGSSLMLSDTYPEHGHPWVQPQGFNLTLQVDDIDAWWYWAMEAGAEAVMPPQKMFWGGRYAQLRDPFGVLWSMNQAK